MNVITCEILWQLKNGENPSFSVTMAYMNQNGKQTGETMSKFTILKSDLW